VTIGQTLAAAREHAGLTDEEVAAATRIRRTLVVAIERDDFSACRGDFYARGLAPTGSAAMAVALVVVVLYGVAQVVSPSPGGQPTVIGGPGGPAASSARASPPPASPSPSGAIGAPG